jgi:hypothetical protein
VTVSNSTPRVLPWFREGNVQARLADHFRAEGWIIQQLADTAKLERGVDLIVSKGTRRFAIEVKGYPDTVYARGPKVGQLKPTNPLLQARHWFGEALLSAIFVRGSMPDAEIGLGFPDFPRYRQLIEKSRYAIDRLGFRILLCSENGAITEHSG